VRGGAPYSELVFRLTGSGADGAALDLDVAPVKDHPSRLQRAFAGRDLLFATCG
jgi:hypothetical protein